MARPRFVLAVILALLAPAALWAGPLSWQVSLAGLPLGRISFEALDAAEPALSLRAEIDNTPLGVFNGIFAASSVIEAESSRRFASQIRTSRKERDTAILFAAGGQVRDVRLTPANQRSALSHPEAVPPGLLDPVAAFGRLVVPVAPMACPQAFDYYDGRRVVRLSPTATLPMAAGLRCKMTYEVVAGPDHLSPLNIRRFHLVLEYDLAEGGGLLLDTLKLRSGIFTLRLRREG